MSRPITAMAVIDIPGRRHGGVRIHQPAAGKASHRVIWTDATGRQRELTRVGYDNALAAARDKAVELAAEVTGDDPDDDPTLGDLVDHYLNGPGRSERWTSPKSARRPAQIARRVLTLEDLDLPASGVVTDPTQAAVRAVMRRAVERGCPEGGGEYAKTGALLKTVFDVAYRDGLIDLPLGNPLDRLRYRTADYEASDSPQLSTVRYVGEEERPPTDRVLDFQAAATRMFGPAEGLFIGVLAFGGARPGEAIGLGPGQIRRDRAGLLIDRQVLELRRTEAAASGTATQVFKLPKWNLRRNAWVAPDLHERLVDLADQTIRAGGGPDSVLFPHRAGGPRWQGNWRRDVFNRVAHEIEWPHEKVFVRGRWETHWLWPVYAFRHHYANYLLKDLNQPLASVARFMGHRDMRVTERMYLKTELTDLDVATAAYRRMGEPA
ncbi:MAG TPA: hypothetical protein VHO26_06910 [Propionibacteriaceae bacterium]|nr:hypothetical protein [Propionibacteriaceae bacterium]